LDIDSEAQKDLTLGDGEAEGIEGGRKRAKKATKPKPHAKLTLLAQVVTTPPPYTPPPGIPQSANSGDDDCAPEFGGDPGNQDAIT
jgi:hypothetical protein